MVPRDAPSVGPWPEAAPGGDAVAPLPAAGARRRGMTVDAEKETQFSEAWGTLSLLLIVLGLITGVSSLTLVGGLLLFAAGAGWLWDRWALHGVTFERTFSERRAFVGETVEVALTVVNPKPLPVSWLRVADRVSMALPIEGIEVTPTSIPTVGEVRLVVALRWYERAVRRYRVQCVQRGFYPFGPTELEAGDPFGLFSRKRRLPQRRWLIVYPRVEPLADLGLPPKDPLGLAKALQPVWEDPIRTVGVRDHRPEDGTRRVHWKATARRQQLQSRVYEPSTGHSLAVVLNVATLARHWQGYIPERLERVVSVAASIAAYAAEQRWPVGLIVNGALPESDQALKVLPGRSPGQLMHILEALAAVSPVATRDVEELLQIESPKLPWGCTLVVVSATVPLALRATLADLAAAGRRVVLVSLEPVDGDDPLLRQVVVRTVHGELPEGEAVAWPADGQEGRP
ncbi:MAG: DUF58 domain-containing protein [Caldilineales bacterium]|nr:DUF58 domain-containing protein [Caldilineales bacterium]MDW8316489.1 DUF58 domain-containing protein [Anaerolineae bacterium]